MDGVEREVQEERLLVVARNEVDGLARERVSQVGRLVHRLAPTQDGIALRTASPHGEVAVPAVQEAEELVEAAAQRLELVRHAEVPLADHARGVARRLQAVGERALGDG